MKQRIIVQAVIKSEDKILLLRRSQGRPEILGKYELPGGRLDDREQPEDAIKRHIQKDLGLTPRKIVLSDALSIRSRDNMGVQNVFLVYIVEGLSVDSDIQLGISYDKYIWANLSNYQKEITLRDSTQQLLYLGGGNNATSHGSHQEGNTEMPLRGSRSYQPTNTVIYSDGGSRGNPGPSAAAFVIIGDDQSVIEDGGEYLGITTNNQAEYQGVLLGLERALAMGISVVEFRIDSMLVVNQLKGIYKIKNRELWPVNERINELVKKFKSVQFNHVPRELNKLADAGVNKILDEHKADSNLL
jgi:ribonuclease HI/ADP-ribose pyrophosphatase YjhB (NUDIX family)